MISSHVLFSSDSGFSITSTLTIFTTHDCGIHFSWTVFAAMPQPELPEPAHAGVDSMLSRKFGKEVANYFSGSLSPLPCKSASSLA